MRLVLLALLLAGCTVKPVLRVANAHHYYIGMRVNIPVADFWQQGEGDGGSGQ